MNLRAPAVAGHFYPGERDLLRSQLAALLVPPPGQPERCVAVVVPHAGYVYSGAVAAETYAGVVVPDRVIVLAVNHRGHGEPVASWSNGCWDTPLGRVPVDEELIEQIALEAPFLRHDPVAHAGEHSLEVQLPFLQFLVRDLRIAPISIASHDFELLERLGMAVAAAVRASSDPILIVASTDFTHYESAASAERKDRLALARILDVDGAGLLEVVGARGITMCGVGPTTSALVAARELGATVGSLVRYANSGQVTGDESSVVGYAGVVVR